MPGTEEVLVVLSLQSPPPPSCGANSQCDRFHVASSPACVTRLCSTGLLGAVLQLLRLVQRDPELHVTSISMFSCVDVYMSLCTHSGNGQEDYVLKLCLTGYWPMLF